MGHLARLVDSSPLSLEYVYLMLGGAMPATRSEDTQLFRARPPSQFVFRRIYSNGGRSTAG